jgi:hypothetical protein
LVSIEAVALAIETYVPVRKAENVQAASDAHAKVIMGS